MIRTYSELVKFDSFEERFEYLKLNGVVSEETFGFDRYLNQMFYNSPEWKRIRNEVIIRDNGCDLGLYEYEIFGNIFIHHMNPIRVEDIEKRNPDILNPEFLISCSFQTHNAIHYGDIDLLPRGIIVRHPNDTCPWK